MFNFVRQSSLFVRHWRHATLTLRASPTHEFQQCLPLSTISTTNQQSLTASYLINKCGFSSEYAISVSNRLQINDPDKADAVISFFESHDFSRTRISNIIKKFPDVLLYDPEKTLFPKLKFYYFKSFSSPLASRKPLPLTTSYLINTCGLSEQSAVSVSFRFKLESPHKADTVISFFKSHGFSQTHISNLIRRRPEVLLCDPEKTLLPKLEFLYSKGFSSHDVAKIISEYPPVLSRSLENHITPKLEFFYSKGFSSSDFAKILCEYPSVLDISLENHITPKLEFFFSKGFSSSDFAKILCEYPSVLDISLEKRIIPNFNCLSKLFESQERTIAFFKHRPQILNREIETDSQTSKLEFFYSKGFSSSDFAKILCEYPSVLDISLEKQIIPNFNCLSKLFESQERTISFFKRRPNILNADATDIAPTINILLENGVSISNISRYYRLYHASSIEDLNLFKEVVEEVKEMGINPSAKQFVVAVNLKFGMSGSEWEDQVNIYKSQGWSEEEFLEAFRKYPQIMRASKDKIMYLMDYFEYRMGLEPSFVAKHPRIVGRNFVQRIIPRATVFYFLFTEGLIKREYDGLGTYFTCDEKTFLEKFVNPYDKASHLLKLLSY